MPARILVVKGFLEGRIYHIPDGGTLTVGRGSGSTLQILDKTLSRSHCHVAMDPSGDSATLRDLESSSGTWVNGDRVAEKQLEHGDRIILCQGTVVLEYSHIPGGTTVGASTAALVNASTAEIQLHKQVELEDESGDDVVVLHEGGEAERSADESAALPSGPTLGLATTGLADPWLGKTLSGYEIQERIGEGSVGVVYRAIQPRMGRTVALKMLQLDPTAGPAGIENFLRGARISGRFQHPNLVALYDAGQAHGCYFLAMEFVDGMTLETRLGRTGPLPVVTAADIARQVLSVLSMVHAADVMHQDIRPASILLTDEDEVKLTDLGIAAEMQRTGTLSGHLRLAPHYLAPEQITRTREVDFRVDLYGIGATLYKMLTGLAPFSAGSTADLMEAIQAGNPIPPQQLREDISESMSRFVLELLSVDPAGRPASADEALAALQQLAV